MTTTTATAKKYTKDSILVLFSKNEAFMFRALLKVYAFQTQDEKNTDSVSHANGMGFRSCDSYILSKLAKWYEEKGYFTPKQAEIVRKKMPVYAGQIAKIANGLVEMPVVQEPIMEAKKIVIPNDKKFSEVLRYIDEIKKDFNLELDIKKIVEYYRLSNATQGSIKENLEARKVLRKSANAFEYEVMDFCI